jgi:hypothetical protein
MANGLDDELDDLFGDDDLPMPTVRGNANLDIQDYQRIGGSQDASSLLDDDLQEDTPSRPQDGPGPATDIDGVASMDPFEPEDGPGMQQTDYGDHPWGPGGAQMYRPYSQARTDMSLGADETMEVVKQQQAARDLHRERDSMYDEPEVRAARMDQQQNRMPSNRGVDPETLYDDDPYTFQDSSQATIGEGIFGMEEGVTWRPRDGIFAHQYAVPQYLAREPELGVQQSEMFDSTANNWRVTQPSAGGVPLAVKVAGLKPLPNMRMEATGPRSHIEAFGRKTALAMVEEAQALPAPMRSPFLASAVNALGPNVAAQAQAISAQLVKMGYNPTTALQDTLAHFVMHAAMRDLSGRRLRRLDGMARRLNRSKGQVQQAAQQHLAPLLQNGAALTTDLSALRSSPAARAIGALGQIDTTAIAPATGGSIFTARNVVIAGVVGGVGWLAWKNRKSLARNARRLARKAGVR